MPVESDSSPFGPIFYLVILFVIVPLLLYVLSRAASSGFQPEPFQVEEMRRLAEHLHGATEKAIEEATHRFGSRPGERRALDELLQFGEIAERFRGKMRERGLRVSGVRQREFFLLENAFVRAEGGFSQLTAHRSTPSTFQGLTQTLNALRYYFDAAPVAASVDFESEPEALSAALPATHPVTAAESLPPA
jgi:hypothetical protein